MANLQDAILQLAHKEKLLRHDGLKAGSRATPAQQKFIDAALNREALVLDCRSGNRAGKSLTLMKIFAVMFREDPADDWKRPKHWVGPLQLLLLSRQLKQAEESLLPKLLAHLEPDTYRVVRSGNALNKIVNLKNGNTILVFSHHAAEQCRAAVQSFDAHFGAIDELPSEPKLIEEVIQRVFVQKGCIALSYTPKVPAPRVKEFLENLPDDKVKRLRLSVLDNPAIDEETRETILSTARAQGESHLRTVLEGEWARGENSVFFYDVAQHKAVLPEHYNPQAWRHVLSADPASASETGLVIAGEDPLAPGQWYIVHASYVPQGMEGQELVREIERRAASFRITRRIFDSAATWFSLSAQVLGITYMPIMFKSNRKIELIQQLNSSLGMVSKPGQKRILLTQECADLEEELFSASWSAVSAEKIAHAHEYHLADAAQYLVDLLPPPEANSGRPVAASQQARMMENARVQAGVVEKPRQKMTVQRRSRAWIR